MEKDYIPFELALELKSLGFYEKCSKYFKNDGTQHPSTINYCYNFKTGDLVSSPLFSQAFRWFREKYSYQSFISPSNVLTYLAYDFTLKGFDGYFKSKQFKTHEEAELECLKKLIEIIKKK